jgi:hypothetical protein
MLLLLLLVMVVLAGWPAHRGVQLQDRRGQQQWLTGAAMLLRLLT